VATIEPTAAPVDRRTPEQIRSQRFGWYTYYWAAHSFPTTVTTVFMSRYLPSTALKSLGDACPADPGDSVLPESCRLDVLGLSIDPRSLFVYTVSACSILLILLMPVVGAIADRTGAKRGMLLGIGIPGAIACALMWFITPTSWQLGTILYSVAFICYSCAIIVYNSILPDLAGPDERDRVSSLSTAWGYLGGGIVLLANLIASFLISDTTLLARLSLASAGVWWLAFAVVPLRRLTGLPKHPATDERRTGSVLLDGFRQLGHTLVSLRRFPLTLLFLAAFLVYNDGLSTVTTVAADYGEKELGLADTVLLPAILMVQFVAFGGALALGRLAARVGAKRVLIGALLGWIVVVLIAYVLQRGVAWQFFAVAFLLALVLGGVLALSRSLFSSMIPAGREAEYFSFYEISADGTSALGPALFGIALQTTGSYRSALGSLLIFFVVGLVLLALVPARRAIEAAGNVPPHTL
jgi:UMF1 family MFS transporter